MSAPSGTRLTHLTDAQLAAAGRQMLDGHRYRRRHDPPCPLPCQCRKLMEYTDAEIVEALRSGRGLTLCGLALSGRRDDDPRVELTGPPYGVDRQLSPVPQGRLSAQARFLAVPVRNASPYAFTAGMVLEVSPAGRAELERYQAYVLDSWSSGDLLATGQQVRAMGVDLRGLDAGAERTVYFPVNCLDCVSGVAEVEFSLRANAPDAGTGTAAVVGTVQVWAPRPAGAIVVVSPAVATTRAGAPARAAAGGVRALPARAPSP